MKQNVLCFNVTMKCNLKCKHCSMSIPYLSEREDESIESLAKGLSKCFEIYEYVKELRLNGGECFFRPDFCELLKEAEKYKPQFGHLMMITNGTYIPKKEIIEALKNLRFEYLVRIDDYGKASPKADELADVFRENGIKHDVRRYNEDEQFMGGWVDMGVDFIPKGFTTEKLQQVFNTCHHYQNGLHYNCGRLWHCSVSAVGVLYHKFDDIEGDSVDLLVDEPIEVTRQKAKALFARIPEACKYCNGHDPNDTSIKRILAAEQISKKRF